MATGTVYLDVDDEITSAAARIRGSEATKVALVVPYGSRIATSRMNFRLLSREAVVNNRRLSIVATDPATRALAASAGLPVFASVAEWDAAVAGTPGGRHPTGDGGRRRRRRRRRRTGAPAAAPRPRRIAATTQRPADAGRCEPSHRAGRPRNPSAPEQATLPWPRRRRAAVAAGPAAPPRSRRPSAARPPAPSAASRRRPRVRIAVSGAGRCRRSAPRPSSSPPSPCSPWSWPASARFLFLPSAEIVVTPRAESDRSDRPRRPGGSGHHRRRTRRRTWSRPSASRCRSRRRTRSPPPTSASRRNTATGEVVFQSLNSGAENTIAKGSIVSTEGGIAFQTTATITLPKATIILGTPIEIRPSSNASASSRSRPGRPATWRPNAIKVVPRDEDPDADEGQEPRRHRRRDPQGVPAHRPGGRRRGAIVALQAKLADAFDGCRSPMARALRRTRPSSPRRRSSATSTPTVDPATLVGKEVPTFELGADGERDGDRGRRLAGHGRSPRPGSSRTSAPTTASSRARSRSTPGDPTVTGGEVSFPVTAKARRVPILDPAELLALVKGRDRRRGALRSRASSATS